MKKRNLAGGACCALLVAFAAAPAARASTREQASDAIVGAAGAWTALDGVVELDFGLLLFDGLVVDWFVT